MQPLVREILASVRFEARNTTTRPAH
jgi:hypothetical protein